MLKELLPKLSKNLQPRENQNASQNLNQSPNLLELTQDKPTFKETLVKVQNSVFIKLPIIVVQLVFLAVIGVNYFLNTQLNRYIKSTDSLVESINKFHGLDEEAKQVTKKLTLYKSITNNRLNISDDAQFLIEKVPQDIILTGFAYEGQVFNMTVKVANPYSLAMLLSTYFDNKNVREVVIKSAILQNTDRIYEINFDIKFKQL